MKKGWGPGSDLPEKRKKEAANGKKKEFSLGKKSIKQDTRFEGRRKKKKKKGGEKIFGEKLEIVHRDREN